LRDDQLDGAARDGAQVARFRVQRAAVIERGGALRVGEKWFAVVSESNPFAIPERVAAIPTALPFALPFTEELTQQPKVRMRRSGETHAL
jgi:hypothetical protein